MPLKRQRSPAKKQGPRDAKSSTGQRLQKVLAAAGVASRRECEQLILEGRVEVDRETITVLGTRVDPQQQEIRLDGLVLAKPRHIYYVLNKPAGVVSTNRDPEGRPRVIDMVPGERRLFTIGRLDRSSEGMIIVTNDGELANQLTHPRYGITKTYRAKVVGNPTAETLQQLRKGVHLAEGVARIESLKVRGKHSGGAELEIVLTEGRNREVRRVLARVGHKVQHLRRIAVGPIRLGQIKPGEYRLLSPDEIRSLRRMVENPSATRRAKKDTAQKPSSTRSNTVRASQAAARSGKSPGPGRKTATGKKTSRKRDESPTKKGKAKRATKSGAGSTRTKSAQTSRTKKGSKSARTGTVLDYDQPQADREKRTPTKKKPSGKGKKPGKRPSKKPSKKLGKRPGKKPGKKR